MVIPLRIKYRPLKVKYLLFKCECINKQANRIKLDIHGSVHHDIIYENDQQDVAVQDNLLFLDCSTCFEPYFRLSSGAFNCITASGITQVCRCWLVSRRCCTEIKNQQRYASTIFSCVSNYASSSSDCTQPIAGCLVGDELGSLGVPRPNVQVLHWHFFAGAEENWDNLVKVAGAT